MADSSPYSKDRWEIATHFTGELRASPEPRWLRVRAKLTKEGLDPQDVVMPEFGPDDNYIESGVLVSRDFRWFNFEIEWGWTKRGTTARCRLMGGS